MVKEGWRVFYIPFGPNLDVEKEIERCGESYDSIVMSRQRVCVIIDDAHFLFSPNHESFWCKIKAHVSVGDVKKLFFQGESIGMTFSHHVPSEWVFGTADELDEVITDFVEVSRMNLSPALIGVIKSQCGNHLGLLRTVLCKIREHCGKSRDLEMDVSKWLVGEQSKKILIDTPMLSSLLKLKPPEWDILNNALNGRVWLPMLEQSINFTYDAIRPYEQVVALGFLRHALAIADGNSEVSSCVEFASPLLRNIARNELLSSLTLVDSPAQSLHDFMVRVIGMMSVRYYSFEISHCVFH